MDLSKTYLNWAERNMQLNFPEYSAHELVHMDVKQYLQQPVEDQFDIIIMDPPTFSNSKRMEDILDIQRDHVELINGCLKRLRKGGVLYFSTNYTKFILDRNNIAAASIADITKATTPFDFVGKLNRQCFKIQIS
jgi:23S rRNA (cytosine1962-C5)-methyltransferase